MDWSDKGRFGDLHGRWAARVEALFKLHDSVIKESYDLAAITLLDIENGGKVDGASRMVIASEKPETAASRLVVIDPDRILRLAQLIPITTDPYPQWYINSHIDLTVYNQLYIY